MLIKKLAPYLLLTFVLASCSQNINNIQPEAPANNQKKIIANNKKVSAKTNLPSNLSPQTKLVTDAISKVSKGVELISESDYEFTIKVLQNSSINKFTSDKLLETLKLNKKIKCEEQKKTIQQLLGDYTTNEYWEGSGYSSSEIKSKIAKYKAFIKETTTHLKNTQIFYVDDPNNLDSPYNNPDDFSGQVGVYILSKVGNDWVILESFYVWT